MATYIIDHKEYTRIPNYMLHWRGFGELSAVNSIEEYGYAIRLKSTTSVVYECYLPDPEYDDCCVYLDGITPDYILDKLSCHHDFINFLGNTGTYNHELKNGYGIDDLLKAIWEYFDVVEFFELGEIDAIPKEIVIEEINQSLETEEKEDSFPNIHTVTVENVRTLTWFDKLLRNKGKKECPPFLWELRITDEEYKELKGYLHDNLLNEENDSVFNREVALYFAEFHRREYSDKDKTIEDSRPSTIVFEGLGFLKNEEKYKSLRDKFISAMKSGAKRLKIHLYVSPENGKTYYLYSLFYNGGLPLKKVVSDDVSITWHRLIRKMLESDERIEFNEEFSDLVKGAIANDSDSLKSFCQELQKAILMEDFKLLPFNCSSEHDLIYQFFLNQGKSVISEIKSRNPFQIQWRFDINRHRKVIRPKYNVSGPNSIPLKAEFFGENKQIKEKEAFSIITAEDGVEICNVTYHRTSRDFYGEESFNFDVQYKNVANITISCPELDKVLVSEELDVYSPQIMRENEDGEYLLCSNSHIGHKDIIVIVPNSWSIEDEAKYTVEEGYSYLGGEARIVMLPSGIEGQQLILKDESGSKKVISATVPLTKVVVMNVSMAANLHQSAYFNVKNLYYSLKKSDYPLKHIPKSQLVFCSDRRTGIWTEEPPLGYIYVKPKGEDVCADPVKILNLGENRDRFCVGYRDLNYDTCTIIVTWRDGKVKCNCGTPNSNNSWTFKKTALADSRYVVFECTPANGSKSFPMMVKTKFCDFQLFDPNGNKIVQNNSYISLAQLPSYKYQIQNICLNMRIWVDDRLRFRCKIKDISNSRVSMTIEDCDNMREYKRTVLAESSLDNLLGGMSNVIKMLYSSQKVIKEATIKLTFSYNGREISCKIRKYPYIFIKQGFNKIVVRQNVYEKVVYDGSIKALPIYNYENVQPVEIEPNDNGEFILPKSVCAWDGLILLVSGKNECILPHAVNVKVKGELSQEERKERDFNAFQPMRNSEYPNALMWSGTWQRCCYWYETSLREHIPAASLFDLRAIIQDGKLLCRFVFNMLLKGLNTGNFPEYQEKLKRNLLDFSKSNYFLWVWIKKEDYSKNSLLPFLGEDLHRFEEFLLNWYLAQMDIENIRVLQENKTPTKEQLRAFLDGFIKKHSEFMDDLRMSSLAEFIKDNTLGKEAEDLLNNEQRRYCPLETIRNTASDTLTDLTDEDESVFNPYTIRNEARNFTRFYERANMFLSQMQGDEHTNIFSMKSVVRRSVLYCTSTFIDSFIKLWLSKISKDNII